MRRLDLGRLGYRAAWERQREVWEDVAAGGEDTLILVEHDPVLTLGAGFHAENLLLSREEYASRGIEVVETDRGGDVTYHGPGQVVAYPIFDVRRHGADLHRWLRDIEQAVIECLAGIGLESGRFPPHTGVWLGLPDRPAKVAAIGVKVRRWVSLHGVALNCANDLAPFSLVVPCGIQGYPVTSLAQVRPEAADPADVRDRLANAFASVFG